MPRSHGVIKIEVWEARSDFRQLPLDAQWAYAMLISQPQINNLGVLPYVPEKWRRFASDLSSERLTDTLHVLEQTRYTITDTTTGELLVRTFIRHDGVWKQPKLVTNARRLYREVESETIAGYLAERHPWLLDSRWTRTRIVRHETTQQTPSDTPIERGFHTTVDDEPDLPATKPLTEGVSKGVTEGVNDGVRARVRDGLGQDQGQGQDQFDLEEPMGCTYETDPANSEQPTVETLEQNIGRALP